jgi:cytochrome P450
MSITPVIIQYNEAVFPDPKAFKPERWILEDRRPNYALDRQLIAFSRGSRQCLGIQ